MPALKAVRQETDIVAPLVTGTKITLQLIYDLYRQFMSNEFGFVSSVKNTSLLFDTRH